MSDIALKSPPRGEKRKLRRSERIQDAVKRRKTRGATSYEIIPKDISKRTPIVKITEIATPPPSIPPTPSTQSALIVARKGEYEVVNDFPLTPLQHEDEIMIRGHTVGLNPIDWKSVAFNFCLPDFPWVTGREMAGVVEKVGKNVSHVRPGDRVWTSTYYRDVRAGTFQEYVIVPQHTVLPIPGNISFEEASVLGVAGLTAAMTLWKWMEIPMPGNTSAAGLPSPPQTPEERAENSTVPFGTLSAASAAALSKQTEAKNSKGWVLIWGGSTVTGQFATQLVKLSGLRAITITSGRTAALSKSLGAEHVIVRDGLDSSDILAEIARVTQGHITHAIDIVGEATAALVLRVLSSDLQRKVMGDQKIPFAPLAFMKANQEVPDTVSVENVEMKRFILDKESNKYALELNRLLESGQLQLPELEVVEGGFHAIPKALELLKKGDMGGRKLIVKV
ncbi:GroES-like protein [Rhizodiscina lignyota]|uniref:GroES-like protein n=1 Tax=Rhizodiscina lignyota TaxID=1504668 RepID=A0A9P4IT93_9PEZI|nr:GroES-like protein [Rhizodiscina lignyota]